MHKYLQTKKYDEYFNHWLLAFCARFLGRKEEAYQHLTRHLGMDANNIRSSRLAWCETVCTFGFVRRVVLFSGMRA